MFFIMETCQINVTYHMFGGFLESLVFVAAGTETLQHLLTNQKQPEKEGRQHTANDVKAEGVLRVAVPTGDVGPLKAPPTAVQLQPLRQPVLHVSAGVLAPPDTKRIKTVPNILSRSKNREVPQKTSAEKSKAAPPT